MRTTVTLPDSLLQEAERVSGIKENSKIIREAVEMFVQLKAARRLAALGGSDPTASAAARYPRTSSGSSI